MTAILVGALLTAIGALGLRLYETDRRRRSVLGLAVAEVEAIRERAAMLMGDNPHPRAAWASEPMLTSIVGDLGLLGPNLIKEYRKVVTFNYVAKAMWLDNNGAVLHEQQYLDARIQNLDQLLKRCETFMTEARRYVDEKYPASAEFDRLLRQGSESDEPT